MRTARAELHRRLICEGAEQVFASHGFAGAPIEKIARVSGVSIGTIYGAFPGKKRAIYDAIQQQRTTEILEAMALAGTTALQRRNDVLDAILAATASLVEYFVQHPDYLRLVLREERSWGVGPHGCEQLAKWQEGIESTLVAIRQGIADGLLVDDDPGAMARTWMADQQTHLAYWHEQGCRMSAAEVTARLQRHFLRAFFRPEVSAARMGEVGDTVG